jgi:hypothetical protein
MDIIYAFDLSIRILQQTNLLRRQSIQHFRVLIKYPFPTISPLIVFEEINVVIIGFDLEIARTFTIPSVNDLLYLVTAVTEDKGHGSFIQLGGCVTLYLKHEGILWFSI